MELILSPIEVRILGCLIEKQATTPDVYPLTLNSLVTACNQKSNREPVMELSESEVLEGLDEVMEKDLASISQSGRSRVVKYQHKLHQRVFDEFNFSTPELAVLCVLFLRGPQTLGEIRSRCARIHEFPDFEAVTAALRELETRNDGPYVVELPRAPGRKEPRYAHLFSGDVAEYSSAEPAASLAPSAGSSRLDELELEVEQLREALENLQHRFEAFAKQFE